MSDLPGIVPQPYALDEKARAQIRKLLDMTTSMKRPCVKCGRPLWFVKVATGKLHPFTDDAVSHFADCPSAKDFKGERR